MITITGSTCPPMEDGAGDLPMDDAEGNAQLVCRPPLALVPVISQQFGFPFQVQPLEWGEESQAWEVGLAPPTLRSRWCP